MPSQLMNRIADDIGMDTNKVEQWYDDARQQVDAKGWSPNESRYWAFAHRYAQRKAMEAGCKKTGVEKDKAKNSRALQSLLKSTLSEIEAERMGIHL